MSEARNHPGDAQLPWSQNVNDKCKQVAGSQNWAGLAVIDSIGFKDLKNSESMAMDNDHDDHKMTMRTPESEFKSLFKSGTQEGAFSKSSRESGVLHAVNTSNRDECCVSLTHHHKD